MAYVETAEGCITISPTMKPETFALLQKHITTWQDYLVVDFDAIYWKVDDTRRFIGANKTPLLSSRFGGSRRAAFASTGLFL